MRGAATFDFQSELVQLAEILDAGGQGESQFLHGAAAGFMPRPAVDADGLQLGRVRRPPSG